MFCVLLVLSFFFHIFLILCNFIFSLKIFVFYLFIQSPLIYLQLVIYLFS